MLRTNLFVGEALLGEDLKQWGCVAVSSLEHLPNNRQEVPDTFWLSAPQRSQQTCPFSSSWRLGGRQVHGVYITVDHTHTRTTCLCVSSTAVKQLGERECYIK